MRQAEYQLDSGQDRLDYLEVRFQRGIESADAQLGSEIANYDDVLVTLTADVANTYVFMRQAEERLAIAKKNIRGENSQPRIRWSVRPSTPTMPARPPTTA